MIDPDALAAELAAMQAARLRRIAARQQAAAEHAERHRHGLAARHARRLAHVETRARGDTSPAGYSRGECPP